VPGLEGVYEVGYEYDRADHVTKVHYPEVGDPQNGGLPAETVTTTYSGLGLPMKLDGSLLPTGETDEDYAFATIFGYDDRARPVLWGHGAVDGSDSTLTLRGYDADQRPARLQAMAAGTLVQDHQLDFDAVGNVVEDNTFLAAKAWRECYGYDARNRLTRAYTTATTEDQTCAAGTPGGGDANFAYNHTYSYSVDGNLTQRVEGADQTDVFTYTYPSGASAVRPHAPTAIDGPSESEDWSYTWDANGHQEDRTVGGNTDTLVWSADRLLDEIQEANGNVKNSFVYDADGNRLVRRDVDGATGYIEAHELNANNSGSDIKVVRTYSVEGRPVAIRTAQGVEALLADDQGSVELTIPFGASTPSHVRAYAPYGRKRSSAEPDTDRGWIGQIEDDRIGLNYLNARYYDSVMGRFLAPDPLYDTARPQTINPYSYGMNSPATYSDPGGEDPDTSAWVRERAEAAGGCTLSSASGCEGPGAVNWLQDSSPGFEDGSVEVSSTEELLDAMDAMGLPADFIEQAAQGFNQGTLTVVRVTVEEEHLYVFSDGHSTAVFSRVDRGTLVIAEVAPTNLTVFAQRFGRAAGYAGLAIDGVQILNAFVEGIQASEGEPIHARLWSGIAAAAPVAAQAAFDAGVFSVGAGACSLTGAGAIVAGICGAGAVLITMGLGAVLNNPGAPPSFCSGGVLDREEAEAMGFHNAPEVQHGC